ncbi:hypothetical protein ACXET9_10925 [Brachybacterium sp. DNPG3]
MTVEPTSALPATGTLRVETAGVRVRLEFGPGLEEIAAEVGTIWGHLLVEDADGPGGEDDVVLSYAALEAALEASREETASPPATRLGVDEGAGYQISGDITREVIRRLIGRAILLHAGIVDHPTLGVVALIGPSGAGKSTAVAHLARDGRYVTDELAILDPEDYSVSPYPKPVSLRRPPERSRRGRKVDLGPAAMSLEPALTCGPPEMLVLLDRIRGGAEPGPGQESGQEQEQDSIGVERVPLQSALPALISQSSSLSELPDGLARLTELAVRTGGVVRVRYRDSEQLVGLLSRLPAPVHEEWEAVTPASSPAGAGASASAPAAVSASAAASAAVVERAGRAGALSVERSGQAVVAESGVVVLRGSESLAFEGLTAVVWDELQLVGEATPDELVARVVDRMGPHPRAKDLVAEALDRLHDSKLLIPRG